MMKHPAILLLALLCTVSCVRVDDFFHNRRDAVARVGNDVLYGYEIAKLIPEGTPASDSIRMVEQYVHSWAFNKLLLDKAEKTLPKSEKDITAEVEEFRKNLLTFRYEKYYLEERLDTLVTPDEMQEWYDAHLSEYVAPFSVIKARVARISPKSPYYVEMKERFNAVYANEVAELEELCYASSDKYSDFGKMWIPSTTLAAEMGISLTQCENLLSSGTLLETDVDHNHFIIFITDRVAPGNATPLVYNADNIHDLIISKRKQDLLNTLEQDLFEEAVGSKQYKRYED